MTIVTKHPKKSDSLIGTSEVDSSFIINWSIYSRLAYFCPRRWNVCAYQARWPAVASQGRNGPSVSPNCNARCHKHIRRSDIRPARGQTSPFPKQAAPFPQPPSFLLSSGGVLAQELRTLAHPTLSPLAPHSLKFRRTPARCRCCACFPLGGEKPNGSSMKRTAAAG